MSSNRLISRFDDVSRGSRTYSYVIFFNGSSSSHETSLAPPIYKGSDPSTKHSNQQRTAGKKMTANLTPFTETDIIEVRYNSPFTSIMKCCVL